MTPLKKQFDAIHVDKSLNELVKLEYALKKHFVYIEDIDELKHRESVIKEFDKAIWLADSLISKLKSFRNALNSK